VILLGKTFGRWKILSVAQHGRKKPYRRLLFLCHCKCGTIKKVEDTNLRSGASLSCGCLRLEQQRLRPFEALYNKTKRLSRNAGVTWSLSYADFISLTKQIVCHYCGRELTWKPYSHGSGKAYGPYNLDRKNNLKGYNKNNVVACCGVCNYTKRNEFSYAEFLLLAPALCKIRQLREALVEVQK
jgi:hypothetical protein